jgi:hypothetical protein
MAHSIPSETKLTSLQLEFLKSLKYMATEKQLNEVKSLLRHYFVKQLDAAIENMEKEKNYTAAIYDSWLKNNSANLRNSE